MDSSNKPTNYIATCAQRSRSLPLELLRQYGISRRGVARQLGTYALKITEVLSPSLCGKVEHREVVRIRTRVEKLLQAAGWEGDAQALWAEFDSLHTDERKAA